MGIKGLVLVLLTFGCSLLQPGEGGLNLENLRYCCSLGTNYANSGLDCTNFQTPIAGIQKDDEEACVHSIDVCCKNRIQAIECDKGSNDAKTAGNCNQADSRGHRKDCCEACQLGIEAGKARQACQDSLGLGSPYDKAFIKCCEDAPSMATTTTSTEKPIPSDPKSTPSFGSDYPAILPPINACDIGEVCAQICIPTADSYKCDCNKGFTLMADGISCKPDKRPSNGKNNRCASNNPCDHECTDTGLAIKCSCREGYELAKDKRTCKDIDECVLGVDDCVGSEVCLNEEGTYYCEDPNYQPDEDDSDDFDNKCPPGYKFNYENRVCDDINECEFDIICPRPKTCINTIGSFKCEGEDRPQCPPGFYYKEAIESCADIDECISGANDCNKESQVCLNTVGNYTCTDKVSKKTCPPGFKKNPYTQNCDDINECEEDAELCAVSEECVNEPGGHTCVPKTTQPYPMKPPFTPLLPPRPLGPRPENGTTSTSTTTTTEIPKVTCPTGYRTTRNTCTDIDECLEDEQACDSTQDCYNTQGSYTCNCKLGFTKDFQTGACIDINECQVGAHDCTVAQRCDNTIGSYLCARITGCGTGYTLNYANGLCEDDDECALGTHQCNTLGPNFKCRNTLGSYRCDPNKPISAPPPEPSFPPQPSPSSYPPQPSPPAYPQSSSNFPPRFPPQPQPPSNPNYPPVYPSPIRPVYYPQPVRPTYPVPPRPPPSPTYPILSGTHKKCLPGYQMNAQGNCEDINECDSNPCTRGQKCLNFNGRYQCISAIQCKIGYELDDSGERCIDINECTRGTHKCNPTQICKNGQGFYTCECPSGHHLNPDSKLCEDIDECKYYRACSDNADCLNTIGSYKCRCKSGFKESGNTCDDIDECKESSRLCEHHCVNIWGSYRCACKAGFTLNFDNRTCTDVDECEKFKDKRLCIGTCENVPGSYKCQCPDGYTLGNDLRTCIDNDECEQNACPRPDDVCLNTRGSHKCYTITCPANYFRDPQHKGRCKRPQSLCDPRDFKCILLPEQYTYHYISLASELPVSYNVQFFQINGPRWVNIRAEFSVKVVDVRCPLGVERVNDRFFKLDKPGHNIMQLYLVRTIQGPQEIELKVEMNLFQDNVMTSTSVCHIFIVVSQYSF